MNVRVLPAYVVFDGMSWPRIDGEAMRKVEDRLRHGEPTLSDLLVAASVMSAYRDLVQAEPCKRDRVAFFLASAEGDPDAV